ncbi:MAG: hypothetical protein Q4A17_15735, partial [Thermoguttaceae bacterium]|nr:hypothetical protein [Thermoguttaceae bacterium]
SWSNPVEQPNSAWSSEPEPPEPYSSPSQRYVDDFDDFFYGYDNSDLYETGLQEYGEVTVTNASGSASYSGYESFYDDFTDGSVGNEGVGSGLTAVQKNSIGSAVSETITDGDGSLIDPVTIITCSYSATPNTRGQNNNVHWSLYRWFWTGDGRASDEVMEAALTAAGNSYFENAEYAHAGLNAVSYIDPTGLAETTNQALYDMEDGKSLTQIGGNAVKNIVYDRVVDKVTNKILPPQAPSVRLSIISSTTTRNIAEHAAERNHFPGKSIDKIQKMIGNVVENAKKEENVFPHPTRPGVVLYYDKHNNLAVIDDGTGGGTFFRPDIKEDYIKKWKKGMDGSNGYFNYN